VIVISRGLARAFRVLARKCVNGRPRGPAPAVVFESTAGTLTVWARTADSTLAHAAPTRSGTGCWSSRWPDRVRRIRPSSSSGP
jgi:hypothetical protein